MEPCQGVGRQRAACLAEHLAWWWGLARALASAGARLTATCQAEQHKDLQGLARMLPARVSSVLAEGLLFLWFCMKRAVVGLGEGWALEGC